MNSIIEHCKSTVTPEQISLSKYEYVSKYLKHKVSS